MTASAPESTQNASDLPRPLGRYLLLRRIARGGMGEVFLATTTGIEGAERPVVVKVIRREHAKDPSFNARFLDEARVQAQLQHSGVAQVLEAAVDGATGEPYAVVEHVEGRSLGDVRARAVQLGVKLGWEDAVSIAAMIAEALAHVHERQDASGKALSIVHRDLSPQNVMLSYSGEIKIIDFGTARGSNRRCHTVAGVVFAKPGYVAPEVANGDPGDARVDLYALGIMLWELCRGQRFLQGDANVHLAMVARDAMRPAAIAEAIGAPKELDALIAKLTAFDRDTRYLAGRAVARDLAKLLGEAKALANGERGMRARAAALMVTLFPGEPSRTRRDFAKLVETARAMKVEAPKPASETRDTDVDAEPKRSSEGADGEKNLLPGTRYRLRREIGRGASGAVFEAEHVDLGRRVAVKLLAMEQSNNVEYAARFRREARALSSLSHEGLVAIRDFGVAEDRRLFCVMELLDGETLETRLGRDRTAAWRPAFELAIKILRALDVAHGAGLVHRDIKPANVFLTKQGEVKLLDFGLVQTAEDQGCEIKEGESAIFGTPEYMAPEQAQPGKIDGRADLYALGCVLYEALTGRLPFVEAQASAIVDAKLKGSPERMRERAPKRDLPAHVDDLVMRALARHPSVRFQSASEMRVAIEAALALPAKQRSARRKIGVALVAAAMAFGAVVVAGRSPQLRAMLPTLEARIMGVHAAPVEMAAVAPIAAPSNATIAPPVSAPATTIASNEVSEASAPSTSASATLPPANIIVAHPRKRGDDHPKASPSSARHAVVADASTKGAKPETLSKKNEEKSADAKSDDAKSNDASASDVVDAPVKETPKLEKTAKKHDRKHKKKSRLAKANEQ